MKIIEFAGQVRKYMKANQIEELIAYSQIDKDRATLIFGDRDHAVAILAKQRVLTELGDYHARGLAQRRAEAAFRMYKAVTAQ